MLAAMAGGMTSRRSGPGLAERSLLSRPEPTPAPAVEPASAGSVEPGGPVGSPTRTSSAPRHCWVEGLPGVPARCPGLFVEWTRRGGGEWLGRVVYAVIDDGQVVLVEAWVAAEHLAPAS